MRIRPIRTANTWIPISIFLSETNIESMTGRDILRTSKMIVGVSNRPSVIGKDRLAIVLGLQLST